jgi:hypothetical protein
MPPPQLPSGTGRGKPDPARNGVRRALPWLFWLGIGLAPVAGILLVLGNQVGPLRAAAVVAVLSAVAIGLSVVLRDDAAMVKDDVEDQLRTEVDRLRSDLDTLRRGVEVSVHRELERVRGEIEVARHDTVLRAESTRINRLTGQLPPGEEYDEYSSHYEEHYEGHYNGHSDTVYGTGDVRAGAYESRPDGMRSDGMVDADYQTIDPMSEGYRGVPDRGLADRGFPDHGLGRVPDAVPARVDEHVRMDEHVHRDEHGVIVGRQESIRYESATYGSVRAKATVYEAVEYSTAEPENPLAAAARDEAAAYGGYGYGGGARPADRAPSGSVYEDNGYAGHGPAYEGNGPAYEGNGSGYDGGEGRRGRRRAADDSGDVYSSTGSPGGRRARRAAREAQESGDIGGYGEPDSSGSSYELVGYRSEETVYGDPGRGRNGDSGAYAAPPLGDPSHGRAPGRPGRGDRFSDLAFTDVEPVEAYSGHAPGFDPLTSSLDGWDGLGPSTGRHSSGDILGGGYVPAPGQPGPLDPGSRYDRNGHQVISGDITGAVRDEPYSNGGGWRAEPDPRGAAPDTGRHGGPGDNSYGPQRGGSYGPDDAAESARRYRFRQDDERPRW